MTRIESTNSNARWRMLQQMGMMQQQPGLAGAGGVRGMDGVQNSNGVRGIQGTEGVNGIQGLGNDQRVQLPSRAGSGQKLGLMEKILGLKPFDPSAGDAQPGANAQDNKQGINMQALKASVQGNPQQSQTGSTPQNKDQNNANPFQPGQPAGQQVQNGQGQVQQQGDDKNKKPDQQDGQAQQAGRGKGRGKGQGKGPLGNLSALLANQEATESEIQGLSDTITANLDNLSGSQQEEFSNKLDALNGYTGQDLRDRLNSLLLAMPTSSSPDEEQTQVSVSLPDLDTSSPQVSQPQQQLPTTSAQSFQTNFNPQGNRPAAPVNQFARSAPAASSAPRGQVFRPAPAASARSFTPPRMGIRLRG